MGLHFIPTSQSGEALQMRDALCLAIFGRVSMDAHVKVSGEIVSPWATGDEALRAMKAFGEGVSAIHSALVAGDLTAFVESPARATILKIDRLYWLRSAVAEPFVLRAVEDATGWDDSMKGQPLLVRADDLPAWERVGRKMPTAANDPDVIPVAARSAAPKHRGSGFKGRSGPKLDMDWRRKVFAFCKIVGRDAVRNRNVGKAEFHKMVKDHHKLSETEKPRDPRRTDYWRQKWLDEQAGLGG